MKKETNYPDGRLQSKKWLGKSSLKSSRQPQRHIAELQENVEALHSTVCFSNLTWQKRFVEEILRKVTNYVSIHCKFFNVKEKVFHFQNIKLYKTCLTLKRISHKNGIFICLYVWFLAPGPDLLRVLRIAHAWKNVARKIFSLYSFKRALIKSSITQKTFLAYLIFLKNQFFKFSFLTKKFQKNPSIFGR